MSSPIQASSGISCSLRLSFAGAVVEVTTPDRRWAAGLQRRYRGFLSGDRPSLVVWHEPAGAGASDLDLVAGVARFSGPAHARRLAAVVRRALPYLLPRRLVFHAAVLTDDQQAWLCCGAPGLGKSTLARLLPQQAMADECAVVSVRGQRATVAAVPVSRARPGSSPLAGLYLLRHGPHTVRRRLSPHQAVARLSRHLSWPEDDADSLRSAFFQLVSLVNLVPVWELEFVPEVSVWNVIRRPE